MKKIALILGTNAGQADLITYLNSIGWETHACSNQRVGPGCDLADYFHLVNIVNLEEVKDLAVNIKADLVYSISSDIAITAATKVSEDLGLPRLLNSEILDLFNNKNLFRDFLNSNNIGNVVFKKIDNPDNLDWTIFPCVVKPVDSQGQRGVVLINNPEDLKLAVEKAIEISISKRAIIEEFLDGEEFSSNVIVQNGEILVNEISDRIVFDNNYFGLPKGHAIPPEYVDEQQITISKKYIKEIVNLLEIKDAVLYVQMKLSNGVPKIIEIAPRLDGCHIWRLIKIHRNLDLRKLVIDLCLNNKIDLQKNEIVKGRSILEFYHLPTVEKFSKEKLEKRSNLEFSEFRYSEGDNITPINGKLEVVGYSVRKK
ncbi:ATP-grasp domain-containing protein [Dokdonia sp. PRO95]|uniref:ATP-grasp domain-containing protein n=1 Tax=Dokdonia sp. PRO95 TaxID=1239415 RepID=UPI000555DFC2|nr:ATP-grasp domain-containing protein [Dokdonia sp. PRO95]